MADSSTRSKAAAVLAEQERLRRRRALRSYALIGLVLFVVAAALWLVQDRFGAPDEVTPVGETALVIGPDDAPHTVVVYEDFLCPFCGQLEAATSDGLEELAADGKVQVEYRPFVLLSHLGDYSERSLTAFAAVVLTSDEAVAKEFHDLLFSEQPSETGSKPSDEDLVALAVQAGADEEAVRAALDDGTAEKWADQATKDAEAAGVDKIGTPLVLLDGEFYEDGRTVEERGENLLAQLD